MLTFAIVTSLNGKGSQNSDTLEVKSESLYYFKGFWRMLFSFAFLSDDPISTTLHLITREVLKREQNS